ncbi:TPA: hypothetical protein ACH3X2_005209 [Trebouxia sp. C0005]
MANWRCAESSKGQKEFLPALQQHLQRLDLVTSNERLQQQFLLAAFGMLCPAYSNNSYPQGLAMTLMDLLVEHKPPNADEATSGREVSHKSIVPIGLSGLQLDSDYQTALGKPQKLEPPSGAPKTLMQLLYLFIQRLEYMSVYQHRDNVTQAELSWCKAQNGVSKSSLVSLLAAMDVLHEHETWALAWHNLGWFTWCKDKKTPLQLKRSVASLYAFNILSDKHLLQIKRYSEGKLESKFAEALASEAAAQLLAEEDKAAAKAASKKAKKHRQKQAKQQTQSLQAETAAASAHELQPEDDHAESSDGQLADEFQQSLLMEPELKDSTQTAVQSQMTSHTDPQAEYVHSARSEGTADAVSNQQQASHQLSCDAAQSDGGNADNAVEPCDKKQQTAPEPDGQAGSRDSHFLQSLFCCPITQTMMTDPVIAADGRTYERSAMAEWLQCHSTSPVTGHPLPRKRLIPNLAAKSAIAAHQS